MRRAALALLLSAAAGACAPAAPRPGAPDPGTEEIEISLESARFEEDPPAPEETAAVEEDFTGGPRYAPNPPVVVPDRSPVLAEVMAPPRGWLARHQAPDGSWDPDPAAHPCGCLSGDAPSTLGRIGTTGLALLSYFGQGETHKTPRHGTVVRAGFRFLKQVQREDGSFVAPEGPKWMREQALAALAMTEAFGMTQSPLFKSAAQRALDFSLGRRESGAGWSATGPPGPTDLETTIWMTMALKSARGGGLDVDDTVFAEILGWTERVTNPVTGTVLGDGLSGEAAAAGVAVTRIFCGAEPDDALLERLAGTAARSHPRVRPEDASLDVLHLFFGSLVDVQFPFTRRRWLPEGESAVRPPLHLEPGTCVEGAAAFFAPGNLGRIAETALAEECRALDTRYRCRRAFAPRDR